MLVVSVVAMAQSTDQNFPTPVTTNEISGTIKVRDIGDSRLTSYFYAFDGGQGDIFINVVTKNFTGDIDVFTADNLRPLTKMVIFADSGVSETGRLVYLRKGERLLLRIEGRSPNDDPSAFNIKFAGSFIALARQKTDVAPLVTSSGEDGGVRVNSVGTRVEAPPKPKATIPTEEVVKESLPVEKPRKTKKSAILTDKAKTKEKVATDAETSPEEKAEETPAIKPVAPTPGRPKTPSRTAKQPGTKTPKHVAKLEVKKVDPLASIRLVIELKDGVVVWRPMNEVLRFSVDKGVLTVISKDGNITRYSLLDVAKVIIQ